jgi:hypothetical protein
MNTVRGRSGYRLLRLALDGEDSELLLMTGRDAAERRLLIQKKLAGCPTFSRPYSRVAHPFATKATLLRSKRVGDQYRRVLCLKLRNAHLEITGDAEDTGQNPGEQTHSISHPSLKLKTNGQLSAKDGAPDVSVRDRKGGQPGAPGHP